MEIKSSMIEASEEIKADEVKLVSYLKAKLIQQVSRNLMVACDIEEGDGRVRVETAEDTRTTGVFLLRDDGAAKWARITTEEQAYE